MAAIIYRLVCESTNKFYIGMTTKSLTSRWSAHCASAKRQSPYHIHCAIRKYGIDAFRRDILEETTTELMAEREQYWIATLQPEYNMTAGGEGTLGRLTSDETRRKISEANRGKSHSAHTRRKMRDAHLGFRHTQESRVKISRAHTRRYVSDDTRIKLSAARKGAPAWNKKDLTGQTFGEWTVIGPAGTSKSQKLWWSCRCSCARVHTVVGSNLTNGLSTRCKSCAGRISAKNRHCTTSSSETHP